MRKKKEALLDQHPINRLIFWTPHRRVNQFAGNLHTNISPPFPADENISFVLLIP
jgi:hypothetical protein